MNLSLSKTGVIISWLGPLYLQVPRWVPLANVQTMEYMHTPKLPSTEHGLPGLPASILDNIALMWPICIMVSTARLRSDTIVRSEGVSGHMGSGT